MMSWMNQMLPAEGGAGKEVHKGKESQSEWSPSRLTTLSEQAARENNEV
jgi:hypothetical protein